MNVKEFEYHFRKLYLQLGMYALRIVGNDEDAEDVVEEAFVKAWQSISVGVKIDNFKHYIYKIVRNECVSFLRKHTDFENIEAIPEIIEEVIDTSARDAKIWKAIDELPDKCRKIFLMSKRDGLSNQEIADELNISIKTVKNQITKGYSRLRKSLSRGHKSFFLPFL